MGNAGTIQPLHKTHFHGWGSWKKASVDKLELLFFACASHDSHTWGEGRWRHILRAQKQKRKKKTLSCKLTSPALACRCNSYKTRKMVVTPECVGVINTHRHMRLLFSLVAMRGQCYDILREPQLPPPSTAIPKILQWLPPRRNSFGDAAWIQEIIEIHSDKVWQYECSHLPEIKGLFGFKPGGNPRDIL